MKSFSLTSLVDAIRDSAIGYFALLGLWMLFVNMLKPQEIVAGLIAALLATMAHATIKSAEFAKFKPRLGWLPLMFWEAWYALTGTWAIMAALFKHLVGRESEAQFVSVPVDAGGDDAESWARRTLLTAYLTIPPNFIVFSIDVERQRMLVHQVSPTDLPLIAQRLGAKKAGKIEVRKA